MKLRLPNKLIAALLATVSTVSQTAFAGYSIDESTKICTITGTQAYDEAVMGASDATSGSNITQFTLAENAVFTATGDQFGYGSNGGTGTLARELVMSSGSKVIVNNDSDLNNHRQIGSVTLDGDATIEVNGNVGLNEAGLGANTLTLNNHTLYLTRSEDATHGNEFRLTNTTVTTGTINIGSGVKMYATADKTFTTNAFTVDGSGTFDIGTRKSLSQIVLAETWTGTIKISNTSFNGENLNGLTNSQSVLELSGITEGHLSQWDKGDTNPTTANIRLTKTTNGQGEEIAAWVYTNGSSTYEATNTFTGTWSGDGMFKKTGDKMECFKWTGNISAWNGSFETSSSRVTRLTILNNYNIAASFKNSGEAEMSLAINNDNIASGQATTVSGDISNTGTGSTKLTVATNRATATFSGTISGLSTIILNGRYGTAASSTPENILDISKLKTADAGTTLETTHHGGAFNIGALSGSGDITLRMGAASTIQALLTINGAGSDGFTGDIILYKQNSSGAGRNGAVVLNHESVAQKSVFITKSEDKTANLALGVNVSNAKLAGINDDAQMGPNHLTIYSGAGSKNANGNNTLELTGSETTYSTAATVQNVNLVMSGTGTQTFTGDFSGFNKNITVKNGGSLVFSGQGEVTASFLSIGGTNSSVTFDRAVKFTGGSRLNIGYETLTGTGNTATFNQGVKYTGNNGYAFVVGGGNTLTLGGTSDMGGKAIGVAQNGELILEENATLTNVGNLLNSTGTTNGVVFANNGAFTLKTGSVLEFTRSAQFIAAALNNEGTILVKGTGEGTNPVLTFDNAYANQSVGSDASHTFDLGAIALDNGEFKNNSAYETAVRNISSLTVDGNSTLSQNSWNTFWNIGALNKGEAETSRSLTWTMSQTHFTNSVLSLTGEGNFDGIFHAKRTNNTAEGNGSYQAYVEISHTDALKHAVLKATGEESSYMTVALNADTVNLAGLQGNDKSILMAGSANKEIGSTSSRQGNTDPSSTGTSSLVITDKSGDDNEFSGKVLGGISITKDGAGTQTFSGDMSAFNGGITVTGGTLALGHTDSTTTVVNGKKLTVDGGAVTAKAGSVLDVQIDGSTNNFVLANGGTIAVESGAKFTNSNWRKFAVEARGSEKATMSAGATATGGYGFDRNDIEISKAKVTYTASDSSPVVKNLFTDSIVVKSGSGTLTVNNDANTLVGVNAEGGSIVVENAASSAGTLDSIKSNGGDVTMKGLGNAVTANLNELFIADERTVSMYQDASGATEANISVSGTLSTGSGATLNANLIVKDGATLNVSGENGLTMGSTVTFEEGANKISLGSNVISGLNSLTVGNGLTLFSGVDAFTIGDSSYDADTTYHASDYFNLAGVNRPWDFVIKYETPAGSTDGGTVSLWMETPEPATATLSLLALAALAARRKRK